ncbi:hypothetical protein DBR32_00400 [Taibaiella sp. KBW10]|uniref:trimeric intracellular cation channel family protein n=1 Tax=Taibaiella sp. KBW10 TaxID=2153357 RepID=UPI000F593F93|nr:trimeric intracellular cation channel family protein [Taibaiella sp. KBW10]RQO32109.1 hypothetical protein DBR32_00400 [Taibaiella sp. KBW10]
MNIIDIISYIGIFVFAIAGALKARTNEMDILGGLVIAFVTAYGGGTIRDVLLGIGPVNWINNNISLTLVLVASFIVFLSKRNIDKFKKTIFISDAIGLGMFTVLGIERSLAHGANSIYAILLGVISATFGGLLSDILCNRVPALLKNGEMYATVCAIGALLYIILMKARVDDNISMVLCVLVVVVIRIMSKLKNWSLPNI